jgi:phospholipid transport system substrate-binding protein
MKFLLAFFSGLLISSTVLAMDVAPDALVKTTTEEVLEIVRKDKDIQSGNTKKAIDLVEAKVLPNFNFTRMTQLAMARDWRQATPAQQKTLTDEFHTLLVRTYAKALTEYKNQTVHYKPFTLKAGETDVRVRTEIRQSGAGKTSNWITGLKSRRPVGRFTTSRSAASASSPIIANPSPRR